MNSIQEIRNAVIRSNLRSNTDDFMCQMHLLRIFFKLQVIGHEPRWGYTSGEFTISDISPVKPWSNK